MYSGDKLNSSDTLNLPYASDLDIASFQSALDLKQLTNSYKAYWLWSIVSLLDIKSTKDYSGDVSLDMKDICKQMVQLAWIPVINYRLNLGVQDKLGVLIQEIFSKEGFLKRNLDSRGIESTIEKHWISSYEKKLVRYVPFLLLSPFYKEVKGVQNDGKKSRMIKELAAETTHIYKIHDDQIKIPVSWYQYLTNNRDIILSWIKYKLVQYLVRRNPNVAAISYKLEIQERKSLTTQRTLWISFMEYQPVYDVLSKSKISKDSFHLDHYLPWSFVQHDQLWNLCPMEKGNNLNKSDSLPNWENTFEVFADNQYRFYSWLKGMEKKNALNEYQFVLKETVKIDKLDFYNKISKTLKPQWQIASNIGY